MDEFMNLVVLPLSALHAQGPFELQDRIQGLLVHAVVIGLPIAFSVRRFARTLPASKATEDASNVVIQIPYGISQNTVNFRKAATIDFPEENQLTILAPIYILSANAVEIAADSKMPASCEAGILRENRGPWHLVWNADPYSLTVSRR